MAQYKLYGYEVEAVEENTVSGATEKDQKEHDCMIVGETDSLTEAKAIKKAGGFFNDRESFVVVRYLIDSAISETPEVLLSQPDEPSQPVEPQRRALSKDDFGA